MWSNGEGCVADSREKGRIGFELNFSNAIRKAGFQLEMTKWVLDEVLNDKASFLPVKRKSC